MPTIVFASPKGGCGKTTAAILLSTEFAQRGASVTVIDADPNRPLTRWAKQPGKPENLTVLSDVNEETLIDAVEGAVRKTAFVIVDLEGTASLMVAQAMSRADLVIIPTRGSALDAIEAHKAVRFVRFQEKNYRRPIPFAVLFTQTSPAIRPRNLISIEAELMEHKVPMFSTQIHDRDAFRSVFVFGGTLYTLDRQQVRNVPAAITNAREFTTEVVRRLDELSRRVA